ncbi:hypothetical protein ACN47E_003521 [Coniothyrium glycines]
MSNLSRSVHRALSHLCIFDNITKEFLEHIHNTFNKPWERYNAHLHFENHRCAGRISPSEWDAGGYFEAEFLDNGRLLLYAHFEEVEERLIDTPTDPDTHKNNQDEERAWHWSSYLDKASAAKLLMKHEDTESYPWNVDADPYPPFPEAIPFSTPAPSPRAVASSCAPTVHTQQEIITVDDTDNRRHLETGIIVGRAMPHLCRDPNVRPAVRAILNKVGAVIAYMPGKHTLRNVNKGDVQINAKDIEYSTELNRIPYGEQRIAAIKAKLEAKAQAQIGSVQQAALDASISTDFS